MTAWPPLRDCEEELTEPSELWLRQINPAYFDNGQVSEWGFKPTPADHGMPSGARSSKTTPEAAYNDRQEFKTGSTAGTWAVSVEEVERLGLRCIDDAACDPELPTGHTYADMRLLIQGPKDDRNDVLLALAFHANKRGCLHP